MYWKIVVSRNIEILSIVRVRLMKTYFYGINFILNMRKMIAQQETINIYFEFFSQSHSYNFDLQKKEHFILIK